MRGRDNQSWPAGLEREPRWSIKGTTRAGIVGLALSDMGCIVARCKHFDILRFIGLDRWPKYLDYRAESGLADD
jgi:hypothetical protein